MCGFTKREKYKSFQKLRKMKLNMFNFTIIMLAIPLNLSN